MDDVCRVLEDEGVAAFAKSFDELLQALDDKAELQPVGTTPGRRPLRTAELSRRPAGQPAGRGARHASGGPHRACWSSSVRRVT